MKYTEILLSSLVQYFVVYSFEAAASVVYSSNFGCPINEGELNAFKSIIGHKDLNVNRNVNRKFRYNNTSTESTWFQVSVHV
jgi:hypothetical protein